MKHFSTVVVFVLLLITPLAVMAQGKKLAIPATQYSQKSGERVGTFDYAAYRQQIQDRHARLVAEQATLSAATLISIQVSEDEIYSVDNYACETCGQNRKERVGMTKPVGLNVDFTDVRPDRLSKKAGVVSGGMMRPMPDGGFVWTTAAESPAATAMRIHFVDFFMSPGAQLYVYNDAGEAHGPYTGKGPNGNGDFWSNTISGSMMYIQLRQNGQPAQTDLAATEFVIADVAHLGNKWLLPVFTGHHGQGKSFCSFNENCVENAACHNNSAVNTARDAVAHIQFISGAYIYICSGGLLADSDAGSTIPYFLTANHCISKRNEANSMEAFFQFTTTCGGACYDPDGAVPSTLGASILAKNRTSDYTFMQLNQNAPGGSAYLGWNSSPIANSSGAALYRISHPRGAPQAYSSHNVDTATGTCTTWPRGNWIYSDDNVGATEGGSSGSPVVDSNGDVVGQLSGACGFNPSDPCDSASNATVDGAFAAYYSNVSQWLGGGVTPPGGGTEMHVDSIAPSVKQQGPKARARATVTILDENGDPVSGATVTGDFTGDANQSASGTTGSNGEVTLSTGAISGLSSFTFCVTGVSGSLTYVPGDNVETCDGI